MIKNKKRKIKIGLALGSGGAKGLAHIGIIKELEKNNIPIDFIAGSSIGSLVGAYYALYKDVNKLENIILSTNWRTIFKIFTPSLKGGFISGEKIEKVFKELFGDAKFNDLKIPFIAIATDLITGNEIEIKKGKLAKAVRASSSVPPIFKPMEYKNKLLVDGGLSNPLPDNIVRKMGANIVIAVNLDTRYLKTNFNAKRINVSSVSLRALNIMRYHFTKYSISTADIVLEIETNKRIGLVAWNYFFNNNKALKIINKGSKIAKESIPKIKKLISKNYFL